MKNTRFTLVALTALAVLSLVLSACGPTGPVTLTVTGLVDSELQLTDADLHDMDVVTITAENKDGEVGDYTGVLLNDLLDAAGAQDGAATLVMTASDGFANEIDIATVRDCADCMVSFDEAEGVYNAIMPGQSGRAWVKGLVSIEVK